MKRTRQIRSVCILGMLLTLVSFPANSTAATDIFLKLWDIPGESIDEKHRGEIDVLAWSWGISNSGTTHTVGGSVQADIHDLSLTKWVDKSSRRLMLRACSGRTIDEAVLVLRQNEPSELEYLKITLDNVLVTGVTIGGSSGDDRLMETVTLNFNKVKVDYTLPKKPACRTPAARKSAEVAAPKHRRFRT